MLILIFKHLNFSTNKSKSEQQKTDLKQTNQMIQLYKIKTTAGQKII